MSGDEMNRIKMLFRERFCVTFTALLKRFKSDANIFRVVILQILTHTAGLALLDAKIQWEDATDHTRMSRLLEEQVGCIKSSIDIFWKYSL